MQKNPAKFIKKIGPGSKKSHSTPFCLKLQPVPITPPPSSQSLFVPKSELQNFTVIGKMRNQIFCIYSPILGLYGSVDQHAMHERIRYEYYCRMAQGDRMGTEWRVNFMEKWGHRHGLDVVGKVRNKQLMYIGKVEETQFSSTQQVIQKYGLKLKIEQDGKVYLHSHCQILCKTLSPPQLTQISLQLLTLHLQKSNRIPATLDNLLAESACKSAIKFGDQISYEWCTDMLYNAGLCDFPWECVHGRPTVHFQGWGCGKEERQYFLQ